MPQKAATTEEMHLWVIYLTQAKQYFENMKTLNKSSKAEMVGIDYKHLKLLSLTLIKPIQEMSGWLEKQGPFKMFYRRYFVLRDGMLYRYRAVCCLVVYQSSPNYNNHQPKGRRQRSLGKDSSLWSCPSRVHARIIFSMLRNCWQR